MRVGGVTFAGECAKALAGNSSGTALQSLLLGGTHALWADGDRQASRDWFDAAYRVAESDGDAEAMACAALGLSGLWLHEYRHSAAAVLVDTRLRRALAAVAPGSSLGLRLSARLAGEAAYRVGEPAEILTILAEAQKAGDAIASAEAIRMAHQCALGPDHSALRHSLAKELIAQSFQTARRGDLLTGLLWRTVDFLLDADPHAERHLADLKAMLAQDRYLAVEFVVRAIEVMLSIRAGRFERAESLANVCVGQGTVAGEADATGWHGIHLLAIRWYQGRIGELQPVLQVSANSPELSAVDHSHRAGLAMAAATAGDRPAATFALARLRGADFERLPRSGSWLMTMYGVAEAANLLDDGAAAVAVYDMLRPYAHLPVMVGPGVACFGSAQHTLGVAALTTGDIDQAVTHLRAAVRDNMALGHWPAATLSRNRLAQALARRGGPGDAAERERELDVATQEAAGLGMTLPADGQRPARPGRAASGRSGPRRAVLRRRGGRSWVIELGYRTAVVEHSLGMMYLATLFASPGCEIPAVQLAAGPGLVSAAAADSAAVSGQPVLDAAALRSYRQRLSKLRADIEEYESKEDTENAARAQAELDWLVTELKVATGYDGRSRTFADSAELARLSVGKAIRRALGRIEAADPVIGAELRSTVTTGLRCCYQP